MGGSSLAPEVLRAVIGVAPGWPRLHMLDSTDPGGGPRVATTPASARSISSRASRARRSSPIRSRRISASACRTPASHDWADHFVAITDEGTALRARARDEGFRDLFINPSDIGGRYSALSFFGLVPAALMGQDVGALVDWGRAMLAEAQPRGRRRCAPIRPSRSAC